MNIGKNMGQATGEPEMVTLGVSGEMLPEE